MNTTEIRLEEFQNKRKVLLEVLFGLRDCFQQLGDSTWKSTLDTLEVKINSESFKIMVIGNFKVGKTTVINALLGENALPNADTTVITEIKWADNAKALLYFRNPLPSNLSKELPETILDHLKQQIGMTPMPLLVSQNELQQGELEKLLFLPEGSESVFEKVELYGHFQLCKNGVEFVDSPGINSSITQSRITRDYLNQVDAVLFVMSCSILAGKQEIEFITHDLQMTGHEYLFFACNRLDQVTPPTPEERQRIIDYGTKKLAPFTQLAEKGIFFLSASQALEGKQQSDQAIVENSGILPLENALTEFLIENRGKIKLLLPTRQLSSAITDLREILKNQRSALQQTTEKLENKEREITPKLTRAREIKDRILSLIEDHRKDLQQGVQDKAYIFLNHFADDLPAIVENMPTTVVVKVLSSEQQSQAEALIKEILTKVEKTLQERIQSWKTDEIQPLLQSTFTKMTTHVELPVENFYSLLNAIRVDLSGIRANDLTKGKEISDAKRLFSYISGLAIGNPFGGVTVTQFEMTDLWAPIARQLGLFVGLMALRIIQPEIFIPGLLVMLFVGGGIANAMLTADSLTKKLKRDIGEKIAEQLKKVAQIHANDIGKEVFENTARVSDLAKDTLEREIDSLQTQMDRILQDKRAGEIQIQRKLDIIEGVEVKVDVSEEKLKEVIITFS